MSLIIAIAVAIIGSIVDIYYVSYDVCSDESIPFIENIKGLKDGLFCTEGIDYYQSPPENGLRLKFHEPLLGPIFAVGFMDSILGISSLVVALLISIPFWLNELKQMKNELNQCMEPMRKTPDN